VKYGCKYGYQNRYGSKSCAEVEPWHQGGADVDAKQDTAFLGKSNDGTLSELAVDRSQWATDLTVSGSALVDASPGQQLQLGTEWSVEFLLEMTSSTSGLLAEFDFAGGWLRFGLGTSGGRIEIARPDTTLILDEANDVVSGTSQLVGIGFAALNDPDPTDAMRIYAYVQNYATGECRIWHVDTTPIAAITRVDLFDSPSAPAFSGGTVRTIRISQAFHSSTELWEDFNARTPAVSRTAETRQELLTPTKASTAGDDGQFAGPVHSAVSGGLAQQDLRLVGPLVAEIYPHDGAHSFTFGTPPAPTPWWRLAPDSADTYIGLPYFLWRAVPAGVNRVRVRVCLSWWTGATITCYSLSRRPGGGIGPIRQFSASATLAATITETWVDLGWMHVARDESGLGTYFALGFQEAGAHQFVVHGWTIEPGFVDDPTGFRTPGGP